MSQIDYIDLLKAINQDDLIVFSSLIKGNENISFGRFSLLSVCYLYNAKKIIKKYKLKLLKIKKYKIIKEPIQIYKDFKIKAGKCLRLYSGKQYVISVLEMLAVLHKDRLVKKYYNICEKTEENIANVKKIYTIYGQNVDIINDKIKIARPILGYYEKRPYKIGLCISGLFIFITSLLATIFNFTTGLGTNFSPFLIYNQTQFYKALNSNGNYVLKSNIILDKVIEDVNFSGYLDGGNFTVYVKNDIENNLIKTNIGTIKNLSIVYNEIEKEISNSFSLLVNKNLGTIENVNITCEKLNLKTNKTKKQDIYINAFANTNVGVINNCNLNLKAKIDGVGDGECYISGFVGNNNGSVKNCIFEPESDIEATEVDVSGIVSLNEVKANIENCKNNATLSQISEINEWSPTIGGIALTNYGNITNSHNLATLTIISNNDNEEAKGNVFLGGICAMNHAKIYKCLNKGSLIVTSEKIVVYCGGITAYSNNLIKKNQIVSSPNISSCGADCNINVSTTDEKAYAFAGGISGYLESGKMTNCYSLATFANDYDETKYFFGTGLGLAYCNILYVSGSAYYIAFGFNVEKICMLEQSNVTLQFGALLDSTVIRVGIGFSLDGLLTLSSLDQIKQQGVYWSE